MPEDSIVKKLEKYNKKSHPKLVRPLEKCCFSTYNGSPGYLGVPASAQGISWHSCREDFANKFVTGVVRIFFGCAVGKKHDVAKFIRATEERLLKNTNESGKEPLIKDKSIFYESSFPSILDVRVSSFWVDTPLKRSMFTMLLRCGQSYDGKDYEKALYSVNYATATKAAVERFLDGYTVFKGHAEVGWYNNFAAADRANKLVKA